MYSLHKLKYFYNLQYASIVQITFSRKIDYLLQHYRYTIVTLYKFTEL